MPSAISRRAKIRWIVFGVLCAVVVALFIAYIVISKLNPPKEYKFERRDGKIEYGDFTSEIMSIMPPEFWEYKTTYSAEFTTNVDGPWRAQISIRPVFEGLADGEGSFPDVTLEGEKGEWVPFTVEGKVDIAGYRTIDYFDYFVIIEAL